MQEIVSQMHESWHTYLSHARVCNNMVRTRCCSSLEEEDEEARCKRRSINASMNVCECEAS